MDPSKGEVDHEFLPFLRVFKDGRVERILFTDVVPPSIDPHTNVSSKDIIISSETGVSARLYLPNTIQKTHHKLPLLIYFHGGCFCAGSAFSSTYHNHLNSLVSEANVIAISVEYKLVPEHPLPTAYDDSWVAIQWAVSHVNGDGPEAWLRDFVDFGRVFLGGDSAGANIAHNMAMRAHDTELGSSVDLLGVVLVQPYFWGKERIGCELIERQKNVIAEKTWIYACPSTTGYDDPRVNPCAIGAPSLSGLGCTRALICLAEKDVLRDRGWMYYETLKNSGWKGVVEIMETQGEDHVFHLFNPTCDKALTMVKRLASFLNQHKLDPMKPF